MKSVGFEKISPASMAQRNQERQRGFVFAEIALKSHETTL